MELIGAVIIVAVVLLAINAYRSGNPKFWHIAADHPDAAYDWFVEEDCWVVLDSESAQRPEPRGDFVGPFKLWIPKLGGRWVTIYGLRGQIEDSERRLVEILRRHADGAG